MSIKLSVVIPVHNEQDCIQDVALAVVSALERANIPYEVLIVNDHSTDQTAAVLDALTRRSSGIHVVENQFDQGFGLAIRYGLQAFTGDVVAIYMGDGSDSPDDLVAFYQALQEKEGVDCVFGTRWSRGGKVYDYPLLKHILNRLANNFIRFIMQVRSDDITNAFKVYRRDVIQGVQPLLSRHYNLTVEIPLKAIIRGYSYAIVPNSWTNRKTGESKLKIKEMGSRYLFIVLYCLLEKWLSRGDYHRSHDRRSSEKSQ